MSAGLSGVVPGADSQERAARLAGALAELGAHRLILYDPGAFSSNEEGEANKAAAGGETADTVEEA